MAHYQRSLSQIIASSILLSIATLMGIAYFLIEHTEFTPVGIDSNTQSVLCALGVINILSASAICRLLFKGSTSSAINYTIVVYAIRESGAVIGFALSYMTGDLSWVFCLAGLALAAGILQFPQDR